MTSRYERELFESVDLPSFEEALGVAGPASGEAEREPMAGHDSEGDSGLSARLLSRSDLWTLPDPEPLVDDVLDQGTTALLYGPWGSGKSFVALDWAASVACGRRWQGRPSTRRRVLYVAAEGAFGLKGRLHAWESAWEQSIEDGWLDVLPEPVNLTEVRGLRLLRELVAARGYGLVVFDTLARCMVGADENSAKDSGLVVDALSRIRESTPGGRGTVLGVHHTGKDGKTLRGSSAFEAGVDTVYQVEPDGDGSVSFALRRTKRKDGPCEDSHRLKISPVEWTESAVISVHRRVDNSVRADRILSIMSTHFRTTGAARSHLQKVAEESGMSYGSFTRGLSDLLESGELVNVGTKARPRFELRDKS